MVCDPKMRFDPFKFFLLLATRSKGVVVIAEVYAVMFLMSTFWGLGKRVTIFEVGSTLCR